MSPAIARVLLLSLSSGLLLAALGCPDPEAVGHAPKEQIDMARERLDKAADKATAGLQEAAKAAEPE